MAAVLKPQFTDPQLPYFRKKMYQFLSETVPTRIKRLMFAASLYGMIDAPVSKQHRTFSERLKSLFFLTPEDKRIVSKLNRILGLTKVSDNSLIFPYIVRSMIWKSLEQNPYFEIDHQKIDYRDIETIKKLDPELKTYTLFIISLMPIWLVYGSYNLIHHDISMLLQRVIN